MVEAVGGGKLGKLTKATSEKATFAVLPADKAEALARSEGFPPASGHLIPKHTEVSKKAIARVLSDAVAEDEAQKGK